MIQYPTPMKFKIYSLAILLFIFIRSSAQDCTSLSFSCTSQESRCVATGSIIVNVTGGSGDYNFKATGPVITSLTSSSIITGLAPGYYKVMVKDLSTGCTKEKDSVYVSGSYKDPRFQLVKTDASCAGNDGTISIPGQQFGRSPFSYTIISPSPSKIGETNSTGSFSGLIPGEYVVQLKDSCGGIQVRRITIENYNWWIESLLVVRDGCDMVDISVRLRDNKGNSNTSGSAFSSFLYGYIDNGDTTWTSNYDFPVFLGTKRNLTILVKDNCGNIQSNNWSIPDNVKPSVNSVTLSNLLCTSFTASVSGQNLTNPVFCLYNSSGNLINCDSSGIFNNLPYGEYCIRAHDACYDTTIIKCFTGIRPTPAVSATVDITNKTCLTFTATVAGQSSLTNPDYCLYDVNSVKIACNSTGVFNDLPFGSYCIKIHDACTDTVITRCFSAAKALPVLTGFSYTGSGCNSFGAQIFGNDLVTPRYCLYDNNGNLITCDSSGIFDNLPYGQYCVRAISCQDTTNTLCFSGTKPIPSVGPNVQISQKSCTSFTVAIAGQSNLADAEYCLYDNSDALIDCDSSGVFDNVPYGSYCIKIHNNNICYDTTIVRCFTQLRPTPSIDNSMQVLSSNCATVSFKVNGVNLFNPTYCLYNASNTLLECNTTGIFNNYAFASYCVIVHDGCVDTTMQVCQTFTPVKGITLFTSKSCTINATFLDVQFASSNSPYSIKVFNDTLVYTTTTTSNPYRIELPSLPAGKQYKVIGVDNCGNKDSASITPDANIVTVNTTVRGKCPSSIWANGSGDLLATANSNYYGLIPQIIKKDGNTFDRSYSSMANNTYTFADLEPAQYIIQFTQSTCDGKLYDTVTINPYAYPTQGHSAVYQCDNNSFSLSANVKDGLGPFSYEIIGSLPETPTITSAPQTSPLFSIDNGTAYSLVRLRTVDACGNATLSDMNVLPLQNFSIKANDSCFYQNITLSVDNIPNANYTWYKKSTPVDSVLLDSGVAYNLPFFVPEQAGMYVCKVNINNGCLTRVSSFNLTGNCYFGVLTTAFQVNGRKKDNNNQLFWDNRNEIGVISYVIERKQPGETKFSSIGTISPHAGSNYLFYDRNFNNGSIQYRLKVVYTNKMEYSNITTLKSESNVILVYPNPVRNEFRISFNALAPSNYRIELISTNGQLMFAKDEKNVSSSTLIYTRDSKIKPGIYLLRIADFTTGMTEIRKLVFD
jgi:hypothetical protein